MKTRSVTHQQPLWINMCFSSSLHTHLIFTPNTYHNTYFFVCLFYSVVCSRLLWATSFGSLHMMCVCVCVLGRENEREKQCLSSWCYLCVCVLNSLRLSSMLHSYYRLKNRWIKKTQTICVPRWCADFLENKKKSLERQNLSCKNHQFHDFKKAEGFHSCQTQTWVFFWLKELRLKIF